MRIAPVALVGVAVLAAAPAAAQAATSRPAATTGLAGGLTPQSATLTGTIDANGLPTAYRFDYGTTAKYGAKTARASAGFGVTRVAATAGVAGLLPATRYHYRIVASNAKGTVRGADRTFTTPKQPLGFSVAMNPNPLPFAGTTVVAGTLGGTGSTNREVQLQQKVWPYTGPFQPVGNVQLTSATGTFAFPLVGLLINAQYRVVTTGKDPVRSPTLTSQVAVAVSTKVKRRVKRGNRLQFSGRVRPARVGELVGVQKLDGSAWKTMQGSVTRAGTAEYATYKTRVRIRRGGTYRVFIQIKDGSLQSVAGSSVRISSYR
jgi:hypothetical protein